MELRQYVIILWRWTWLILLGLLVGAGAGFVVSEYTQPVYSAASTILINQAPSDKATDLNTLVTNERLARTYVELLTKRPVLEQVAEELGLEMSAEDIAKRVEVDSVRDTQLIQITVESTDPNLAAALANTIPEVFKRSNEAEQLSRYSVSKASLAQELNSLNQQIQLTQNSILAIGIPSSSAEQIELARLQSEVSQLRQSYTGLLQSYENIRLAETQSLNSIQLVEPALVPREPVRPRSLQNVMVGVAFGLLGALGIAFLFEYFDDRVRTPEQAGEIMGAPVMGVVARLPSNGGGKTAGSPRSLIAATEPRSPVVEGFRTLRTNIQFAGVDRPLRTLLITSAVPVEGKSTVASNLAVVIAQAGIRVALIDCDLRRPSVHRIFDLPNRAGLTDVLLQASGQWETAPLPTAVANLSVVSSGSLPPNPSELLGSERFRQFVDKLTSAFDVLIFDSPPLLPVTDAAVLGRFVDGVLMVVDSRSSRAGALVQSRAQLERVGANLLGVVVNRVSERRHGYSRYYYTYYADEKPPSRPTRKPRPAGHSGARAAPTEPPSSDKPSSARA